MPGGVCDVTQTGIFGIYAPTSPKVIPPTLDEPVSCFRGAAHFLDWCQSVPFSVPRSPAASRDLAPTETSCDREVTR